MPHTPIWDFYGAHWIDHNINRRFAIYNHQIAGGTSDDAVLDKETGLVWERTPSLGRLPWDAAIVQSFSKAIAGRKGWRLPAIEELLSLVDPAQASPTLPAGHPFQTIKTDYFYWSSTMGMTNVPTCAWGYNFGNGDTSNVLKSATAYVWFVRAGYGHDYPY